MAIVKCPNTMTSITLATSGVLVPDADSNITVTVAEATALCYPPSDPRIHSTNLSNGNTKILFPGLGGILLGYTNVLAVVLDTLGADAIGNGYTTSTRNTQVVEQGFILVQG